MTPMPFAAPIARVLLRSQSDERLVTLARDGHQGAFDEIVRRYRPALVSFAAAYATPDRTEDVVQESLANAWVALRGSDSEIALKPWLYTIVRNRALNARRDARFHEPLDETIDGVRRPDEIALEHEQLQRVVLAVSALPDGQRKALVDSALEGRTHDQIASELGTSAGSVRGLIHRGRVAVREAAGSVVPLPVVAAVASSAGEIGAAGMTVGGIAGGSFALKGATVATIAILATGSGLVVERSLDDSAKSDREASAESQPLDGSSNQDGTARGRGERPGPSRETSGTPGGGDDSGRGGSDGEDSSGRVNGSNENGNSGPGGGDDSDSGEDPSGPGGGDDGSGDHSGPGSGDDVGSSGSGSGGDSSGSDSSGSGSSGSDSSGSGSSGSDSSGSGSSGSDSSGSGSGSSGSGSGSGDDLEDLGVLGDEIEN